jgi:hypothetical protein
MQGTSLDIAYNQPEYVNLGYSHYSKNSISLMTNEMIELRKRIIMPVQEDPFANYTIDGENINKKLDDINNVVQLKNAIMSKMKSIRNKTDNLNKNKEALNTYFKDYATGIGLLLSEFNRRSVDISHELKNDMVAIETALGEKINTILKDDSNVIMDLEKENEYLTNLLGTVNKFIIDNLKENIAEEEKEAMLSDLACKVCLSNKIEYVFSPCGHSICSECLGGLSNRCHICRSPIVNNTKLFFS